MRVLLLLMLIGCGSQDVSYGDVLFTKATETVFFKYIGSFERLLGRTTSSKVFFGEIDERYAAVCRGFKGSGPKQVIVDKETWENLNEVQREQLIFHELGHCDLDLEHNDTSFLDIDTQTYCPSSVMRYKLFNKTEIKECYQPFKNMYIDELFK